MVKLARKEMFLSCSFHDEDKNLVRFFESLCNGLGIQCIFGDKGFAETVQEMVVRRISDSDAFLAIASRRDEISPGNFSMPKAVNEEITVASTIKKPTLIFAEEGVDLESSFINKHHFHIRFNRESLADPIFLKKAIESIHNLKMGVISIEDLQIAQIGQEHIFAESAKYLVELVEELGSPVWKYSLTRCLRFTSRFSDPIPHGVWAVVPTSQTPKHKIEWKVNFKNGNKSFKINSIENDCTSDNCLISLSIEPIPEADDCLEYSVSFKSQYLNPLFQEDIEDPRAKIVIDGSKYLCLDGMIPIIRTQDLKIQFRFPPILKLDLDDFVPFVGSYVKDNVDYLVKSEMRRMTVNKDDFGGNIFIEISVSSPLPQHMYGVAWNPAKRLSSSDSRL